LLAGEYPGAPHDEPARLKLRRLLRAGITFFLDLTEVGELHPYAPLLPKETRLAGRGVEYQRLPIRDFSTPTPEKMAAILDTIDTVLAAGHTIYVHCWGGIGRPGRWWAVTWFDMV
jgi:protein-tyrosine phosphatase